MTIKRSKDVSDVAQVAPSCIRFEANLKKRYRVDNLFKMAAWAAIVILVSVLAWLMLDILISGIPTLNWSFLTSLPASEPDEAGILAALVGTAWVMLLVALFAFPVGVGSISRQNSINLQNYHDW